MQRFFQKMSKLFFILFLVFPLTYCTSKITEEQMALIQELKRKEMSLKEEIRSKKASSSELQAELQRRKAAVDNCQERLNFVKEKLSQWPNVWPEVRPLVPREEQ